MDTMPAGEGPVRHRSRPNPRPTEEVPLGPIAMHPTLMLPPAELFQRALGHDLQAGLSLLLQAHRCARDVGNDPWDFSVDANTLRDAGLTGSHLRWLLCKGCLRHARETTRPGARRRTFRLRPATNLKI